MGRWACKRPATREQRHFRPSRRALQPVDPLSKSEPIFFFLMLRRPPSSTLFPYSPLFRSAIYRRLSRAFPVRSPCAPAPQRGRLRADRKSTRLNSSHEWSSYAVFCLKKKKSSSVLFAFSLNKYTT